MYFCNQLQTKRKQTEMSQPSQQVRVRLTGVSALLHFLVDGLCICCLYLTAADSTNMVMMFMTYNVLAFLTQPLTGGGADRLRQKHWMLLGAVVLLTLAVMMASMRTMCETSQATQALLLSMTVCLGMGNSLFHVWGGKQTAIRTKNDIRSLGVFVSTGAFGLAIGGVFASWLLLYVFLLSICVLAVMALFFFPERKHTYADDSVPFMGDWKSVGLIIPLIMLIVAGRSFVGEAFTTDITKGPAILLMLGATSMFGKMAGGWLVKGMGMWKAVVLMVVGTLLCFIGKDIHIAVILTGLFLVNCTMPVTLYWANVVLKGYEGLAFGLLAAALMPGYLLVTLL